MSPRSALHPVRIALILGVTSCAAAPEATTRTLEDFERLSRANATRHPLAKLTGLQPTSDWPFTLWVERSADAAVANPSDAPLFLAGVRRLSRNEALALARFAGGRLFLPDLESLDATTARLLAGSGCELYLDGLSTLDAETARILATSGSRVLSLGGLRHLTPELATILASFPMGLRLHGLSTLDLPTATRLAQWQGWGEKVLLSLSGLQTLDADLARVLATCRGWGIALDGLESLSPAAARELGRLDNPYLSLDGLTTLPRATAEAIAPWQRKFLTLNGLTEIDPELRALVARGCEAVSFRSLR